MKRLVLGVALAAAAVTVALAVASRSAAQPGAPVLVRVSTVRHRVVAVARLPEGATPLQIEVAHSSRLTGVGFATRIVLRESISAVPGSNGLVRVVTHKRVAAGRYWVAISSAEVGMTDCVPIKPTLRGGCPSHWSNALPLTVR